MESGHELEADSCNHQAASDLMDRQTQSLSCVEVCTKENCATLFSNCRDEVPDEACSKEIVNHVNSDSDESADGTIDSHFMLSCDSRTINTNIVIDERLRKNNIGSQPPSGNKEIELLSHHHVTSSYNKKYCETEDCKLESLPTCDNGHAIINSQLTTTEVGDLQFILSVSSQLSDPIGIPAKSIENVESICLIPACSNYDCISETVSCDQSAFNLGNIENDNSDKGCVSDDDLLAELESEFRSNRDDFNSGKSSIVRNGFQVPTISINESVYKELCNKYQAQQTHIEYTLTLRKQLEVENTRLEQKLAVVLNSIADDEASIATLRDEVKSFL